MWIKKLWHSLPVSLSQSLCSQAPTQVLVQELLHKLRNHIPALLVELFEIFKHLKWCFPGFIHTYRLVSIKLSKNCVRTLQYRHQWEPAFLPVCHILEKNTLETLPTQFGRCDKRSGLSSQSPSWWKTDPGNTALHIGWMNYMVLHHPHHSYLLPFTQGHSTEAKTHLWIIFCCTSKLLV